MQRVFEGQEHAEGEQEGCGDWHKGESQDPQESSARLGNLVLHARTRPESAETLNTRLRNRRASRRFRIPVPKLELTPPSTFN